MSRDFQRHRDEQDAETYRRHVIKPNNDPTPALKTWDGVQNSQLRGLFAPTVTPQSQAKNANELTRRAFASTVADEHRTEGHQIKHRTNPHE